MGVFTGYCPKCGVPMEKRKFIDTWDSDGTPDEIHEDWYCSECLLRWVSLETEPEELEKNAE